MKEIKINWTTNVHIETTSADPGDTVKFFATGHKTRFAFSPFVGVCEFDVEDGEFGEFEVRDKPNTDFYKFVAWRVVDPQDMAQPVQGQIDIGSHIVG